MSSLHEAARAGYSGRMLAHNDGTIQCRTCRTSISARQLDVDHLDRRGSGAVDEAAEMMIVAWARCSACGCLGATTLGYGPNAGEADIAVLDELDLEALDGTGPDVRPVH